LIGHSAGNPLILSILDHINVKIKGVVQVAGFSENLTKVDKDLILQSSYNWEKMKNNVENLFFINSDNDPWGCDDVQGRKMFDKLGGNLLIRHGEGHMGSDTFNQPYKKFPLLLKIIESFS
jgi:predicted alpha/beta hydrolase family esterase